MILTSKSLIKRAHIHGKFRGFDMSRHSTVFMESIEKINAGEYCIDFVPLENVYILPGQEEWVLRTRFIIVSLEWYK